MKILAKLSQLNYRDGFWLMIGTILGCQVVRHIKHLADFIGQRVGG